MIQRRSAADYERAVWRILATPDRIGIWEWQCLHGRIPEGESGKPGPWLPSQARLFRNALQVITARLTQRALPGDPFAVFVTMVVVCGPSQIGKTKSFLHPIVAYCIDVLRTNCAFITHKRQQIRQHLRVRLLPMFEATPRLARYLPPTESLRRERLAGNLWQLEGANLHAICGNVASDLREYSHQVGVGDEIEAWAKDVDGEGNPVELFLDRQKRYQESSIFAAGSTPGEVNGHTWSLTCQGSHQRLLVACLGCGHHQDLSPNQLRATDERATPDEIHRGDLARWHCKACDRPHTSDEKDRIVGEALAADRLVPGTWAQDDEHPAGHWEPGTLWRDDANGIPQRVDCAEWDMLVDEATGEILVRKHRLRSWQPPPHARRSYQFNYLHDRDCSCGRFLAHELRAQRGNAEQWKTHQTGWRAEPVLTAGIALTAEQILESTGTQYRLGFSPAPARWLLVICDQQGNTERTAWFPYEVRAVAEGGESWLVDAGVVNGFDGLRALEERQYPVGGVQRSCDFVAVDGANGQMTRHVRAWALEGFVALVRRGMHPELAKRKNRRVILVGDANLAPDVPWSEQVPTKRQKAHHPEGVRIFRWNSLHWKDRAHQRLSGNPDHPAAHLPRDDAEVPRELARYLRSLTSEERVFRLVGAPGGRRIAKHIWQPRAYVDSNGVEHYRSDTHWWDAFCMGDVLSDLVGAHRTAWAPAQEAAGDVAHQRSVVAAERREQRRKAAETGANRRRRFSRLRR